jgi:hypothetical protein
MGIVARNDYQYVGIMASNKMVYPIVMVGKRIEIPAKPFADAFAKGGAFPSTCPPY